MVKFCVLLTFPLTVTVNEHVAEFPDWSATVYVTVVTPEGNAAPLAKPPDNTVDEFVQLSVPTGAL